jgi:uncharacterized membrane protein/mono/diheme cytochrome c family protein
MTPSLDRLSQRSRFTLLALTPILLLFILVIAFPPDGSERAQWAQFIGRFHPIAVHLPIAFILLVPVLELGGRSPRFPYLRLSADFVLGLATLSAMLAAILGWCLARSGGYSGPLMTQHMWSGVWLATLCLLCWVLRERLTSERSEFLYSIALAITVGLMTWTGYRGGQLSRGEDHLTEFMPAGLRKLLMLSVDTKIVSPPSADTFYGARIHPIFANHCFTCHGPEKHKSNLRLDSYTSLMRGGKHGTVIKAGNVPSSELFRRITLPTTDDDYMPKENKRPLSADEVKLIQLWIAAGASATLPLEAIKDAPAPTTAAAEVTFENIDFAAVAKQRAALAPAVAQLQKRFPNVLDYESRASADLMFNASLLGEKFEDADLASLFPVADHIVIADFSRTAITDRSAPAIAAMKRLRLLRLVHTKITDATVHSLSGLDQLESLNIFGTRTTPAVLAIVASLPKLRHLYAGETTIRTDAPLPAALKDKVLF